METKQRLQSLDALRGFDMLFIMGFSSVVATLCGLWPGDFTDALAAQMHHVSWNGLTQHDTIFPLFLFIAGVTFPYSASKSLGTAEGRRAMTLKVLRRALTLVVLGIIGNGLFRLQFDSLRLASVLGRIGIAWAVAAILYLYCKQRTRIIIASVILVGYALLICLVPSPDAPAGASPLSIEGTLAGWVDRTLLPGAFYGDMGFDPEGLLSTVPAVVTAMLGIFTGSYLRSDEGRCTARKALYLFLAAVALTAVGLAVSPWVPVNKTLWSSSFVCVVGGYSLAMLALFYYLIDVLGYRRWAFPFRVIGLNSITIYVAQWIIPMGTVGSFFLGGLMQQVGEPVSKVLYAVGYTSACWVFLYLLYRKNIFLKV